MTLVTVQTNEIANFELIADKAKFYIGNAKSENTRKAYRSDWKDFLGWCESNHLTALPASPETVVAYIVEKAETLKTASLDRRLVSIRAAHSMAGHYFDKNNALISETMKGIKNTIGTAQTMKSPVLIEDLRAMVKTLGADLKGIRDKALLLVGFTGAFRRSELVGINVEDLSFKKEGIEILLRRSKTDQTGKGETIPIPYGSNLDTCPVRSLKDWLDHSKVTVGPLFRAINKHGHINDKGMCSASVALIIKRNDHIKSKEGNYSGHSLRAGFCTQAATNGVSDTQGMKHSRHKKFDTWRKYVRLASVWQDSAATKLGL
jgi:site-specific recombinase XerD